MKKEKCFRSHVWKKRHKPARFVEKGKAKIALMPLVLRSSIVRASPKCYHLTKISRRRLLCSTCMELIMVLSANTVAESLSVDWLSKVPCVSISNTATWWRKTEWHDEASRG